MNKANDHIARKIEEATQAGALQAALAVDCPHCWQKAGQPCIWPETRTSNRDAPHDARKAAALASPQPSAACDHEWVSARNKVIESGEICAKLCGAIRPEQPNAAREREQRERMAARFANRTAIAATAEFDLPAESDAVDVQEQGATTPVLDACCGSRMFWFDRKDARATFVDVRRESHRLTDSSSTGGYRDLIVDPDQIADFTNLPFAEGSFSHVVFDPPHFERNGDKGWVGLKYGTLKGNWREMLRAGFAECFRVLKPEGTLIFKWCSDEIPLSQILALTPEKPLYGHRSGKQAKTHWVAFLKGGTLASRPEAPAAPSAVPDGLVQAFRRRGFRVPDTLDDAIASAANIMIEDGCILDHAHGKQPDIREGEAPPTLEAALYKISRLEDAIAIQRNTIESRGRRINELGAPSASAREIFCGQEDMHGSAEDAPKP